MKEALKQFLNKPDDDISVSLIKLVGKEIKDIEGYIGNPYGGGPIFNLCRIYFEDGTDMFFEGEHDVAYLSSYHTGAKFLVDLEDLYEEEEDE